MATYIMYWSVDLQNATVQEKSDFFYILESGGKFQNTLKLWKLEQKMKDFTY